MARFTITIKDNDLADLIASLTEYWTPESGLTKPQFARAEIKSLLQGQVRSYRQRQLTASEPDIEVT